MKNQITLNYILLLSVLLTAVSCDSTGDTIAEGNIQETIIEKEREALNYWSQGNTLGMSVNYADDITYFDDINAHTRLDGLDEVQKHFASLNGAIPAHTYEIVDPKVQVYGNIAILTLQYHATGSDGEPGPPWKASSIYEFKGEDWKVVHAHWSLIKEQNESNY